jgi:4-carboxymuconolactone decarboxylase
MRLPPLPADQWGDPERAALADLLPAKRRNPRGAGTAMATLVRHPDLARAFLGFGGYLLMSSSLPPRLREVAILRVARRRDCAYEWTHHVEIAAKLGLSDDEIEAAGHGKSAVEPDATVLAAVDELETHSTLSDRTWTALGEHLDEHQRMDLVFTVGGYGTLAMAFNAFGVEPEADSEAEPEEER